MVTKKFCLSPLFKWAFGSSKVTILFTLVFPIQGSGEILKKYKKYQFFEYPSKVLISSYAIGKWRTELMTNHNAIKITIIYLM